MPRLKAAFSVCIAILLLVSTSAVSQALRKHRGLVITPLRSKISLEPGNTTAGKIKLTNDTTDAVRVQLSVENFHVVNEAYDYGFSNEESAQWVRFVDNVIALKPGESKEVSYSLAIPQSATPGGYNIALFATIQEKPSTTTLTEFRRVASLIYLNVEGSALSRANLLSMDIPWLVTDTEVPIQLRIANQGNTHIEADIMLTSQAVITKHSGPKSSLKAMMLPSSVRALDGAVSMGTWPGLYHVYATYALPQGGEQVIGRLVFYCPGWFIGILLFLVIFIWLAISEIKHYRHNQKHKRQSAS